LELRVSTLVARVLDMAGFAGLPRRRRRMRGSRGVGQDWEDLAAARLTRAGYRILERNYRAKSGEIDFIAMEGSVLCFIEVKGRRSLAFGRPEEAVGTEKQRRIIRAAQAWLRWRKPEPGARRFDVVSILDGESGPSVVIFRGAFEGPLPPRRRR
jgi:putative endonuclease